MPAGKKTAAAAVIVLAVAAAAFGIRQWQKSQETDPAVAWGNVDTRTVNLAFEGSGRIASLEKEEGEAVKAGELLGTLDTRLLAIELSEARSRARALGAAASLAAEGYRAEDIAAAEAEAQAIRSELALARSTEKRQNSLLRSQATSAQNAEAAAASRRSLEKKLAAAEQNVKKLKAGLRVNEVAQRRAEHEAGESAAKALEYRVEVASKLVAPIDGVIRSRLLEPGDMAGPAKTVYAISVMSPKWVRAYVTERQLGLVREGGAAVVSTDTTPDMQATVGYVSSEAEFTPKNVQTEDLRTLLVYEVRLNVEDAGNRLRLGQPVTVRFRP